jgi:hypothetical protein
MQGPKPDAPDDNRGLPVKAAYSTPTLSDFGSVETLSLTGTQNPKGENPGVHAKNKP